MSFRAQLVVQGEPFAVRHFSWAITQRTDVLGRPAAHVEGGTLEIALDSQPSETLEFWATSSTKRFDGVVKIFEPDSTAVRDEVRFFDAHCVGFHKQFQDANSIRGMTLVLSLSANKLQYAEMEIHNNWPDAAV